MVINRPFHSFFTFDWDQLAKVDQHNTIQCNTNSLNPPNWVFQNLFTGLIRLSNVRNN